MRQGERRLPAGLGVERCGLRLGEHADQRTTGGERDGKLERRAVVGDVAREERRARDRAVVPRRGEQFEQARRGAELAFEPQTPDEAFELFLTELAVSGPLVRL